MWIEFVVGSFLCSESFFSGYSSFPLFILTNTSRFQFDLKRTDTFKEVHKNSLVLRVQTNFKRKKKRIFYNLSKSEKPRETPIPFVRTKCNKDWWCWWYWWRTIALNRLGRVLPSYLRQYLLCLESMPPCHRATVPLIPKLKATASLCKIAGPFPDCSLRLFQTGQL